MNASQMPPPTYGYVIYRDTPSTEPFDPTAPLQFFPPKDSDDLFFALKMAYPLVSTHAERMRNAVIDFLMGERDAEQAKSQSPSFLHQDSSVSMDSSTDSTRQSGSSSSLLSSPDMMTMPTPSSTTSPAPWAAPMSRTVSNAQSSSSSRAPVTSPLAIDEMTSVFSLSSQAQPRTRVRRKMTDAEKVEYRKRRIVKACEKCSKRKRKCQHNQPMMEKTASPRKAAQLSPQSLSTKALGKQAVRSSRTVPTSSQHFDVASTNSLSYQTTEEEQDQSMEDLIDFSMTSEFDTSLFPWSDTLDWTLLDNDNDQAHRNESLQVSPRSITHSHFQTHGSQASGDSLRLQDNASHEYRDRWHGSELEPESHQLFAVGASMSGPTHTLHNHLQHKPDVSGVSSLSTFTPTLQSPVPHLNDQHMDDQQGDRRFEHLLGMLDSQNVTSSASSSRQQQPLKRRIPKALHSVVVGEQAEHEQFDWHMDADGNGDEGQVPLGQQPLKRRSSNGLRKLKASMHGQSARGSHLSALVIQDDGDKMHSTSTLGHNAGSHFSGIGSGFKGKYSCTIRLDLSLTRKSRTSARRNRHKPKEHTRSGTPPCSSPCFKFDSCKFDSRCRTCTSSTSPSWHFAVAIAEQTGRSTTIKRRLTTGRCSATATRTFIHRNSQPTRRT